MSLEGVARTTKVSTDISRGCEHCGASIGYEDFTGAVNHFIQTHGYKLIHVGTETISDRDDKPWHTTVAILGSDNPPPLMPTPTFDIQKLGGDADL